jgi:sugar (pentulose or hexulose) kinase
MSRFLLGIDAGSSMTKAAVFDRDGTEIASSAHRIVLERPQAGWCETDPAAAWNAARTAIRTTLDRAGMTGGDIAAVGISAAMVGAWLVDAQGNALRPGIIWEDSRTQEMLDGMAARDSGFYHRIFQSDGCVMQQGCTLPLIGWLRGHEPDIIDGAAHIFSYKDFLRMKLTGLAAADRTEAAVAPGDARLRDRSGAMLELFGLVDLAEKLPPVADSESIAGWVTAEAAAATGLRPGTPVAIGAGDVPATIAGASALEGGTAMAVLGTTCIVGVVSDAPFFTPPDLGLLFTLPGEAWFRAMVNVAGTLNLDWAIETIMGEEAPDPAFFARLEATVSAIPIGSDGVVFLPYLSDSGIIAPVVDAQARAGFYGLTPRHGRAHMMRAVYEGVVLAIRDLLADLPGIGDALLLTGGGAKSQMWTQMIADALGGTVHVPAGTEFGARGAALLAGTAIGWFPSIRHASVSTRQIERSQAPNPTLEEEWDRAFAAYRKIRERVLATR